MFVSVTGRNNETMWAHIAMWARTSLFHPFTDTNMGLQNVEIGT